MVENVVIIGSGPAGYAAAIYCVRNGLNPLLIRGYQSGGQLMLTSYVENYPGFKSILGTELMDKMFEHAKSLGCRMIDKDVSSVDFTSYPYKINVEDDCYEAYSVVLSTGASSKWLGLQSEKRLIGKGVSGCAVCLPPSSLIVTNPSTSRIDSISENKRVLTIDGNFSNVSKAIKRDYTGKLINFSTRMFRSERTRLTPNHPILVKTLKRGVGANYHKFKWSDPFWLPAGELKKGHIVLYPIPKEERDVGALYINKILHLPVDSNRYSKLSHETYSTHRIKNKIEITPDFMRLIGYFLSDGSAHSRGVSFYFAKNEAEYAKDCKRIIEKTFGIKGHILTRKSTLDVNAYSLIISKLFDTLFGRYSDEKKAPSEYITMKKKLQKELIKGIWRGDGCMRKKDFIITSSSRALIEQIKLILLRLSVLPQTEKRKFDTLKESVIEGRTVRFKKDVYQVVVGGPWLKNMSDILGIRHPLLNKRAHFNKHAWILDGYANLPVRDVKIEKYSGPVYNLAVERNNTYVTTNSIVHNCDGPFFKNKDVIVVGGGDSAMEDSLFLTKMVKSVTIIHRRDSFKASKIMQERVLSNPKIKVVWNSEIKEIIGKDKVEAVTVKDTVTGKESNIATGGVFIAIGHSPNTTLFNGQLELDESGYIKTHELTKTSKDGVFAAGDVQDRKYKQAIVAAGWGSMAALDVFAFLNEKKLLE